MIQILFSLLGSSTVRSFARHAAPEVASAKSLKSLMLGRQDQSTDSQAIDARFDAHYRQYVLPQVETFEARRVETLGKLRQRMWVVVPLAAMGVVGGIGSAGVPEGQFSLMESIGGLSIMGALAAAAWASWPVLQFKGSIKEQVFAHVFSFLGPQWQYVPSGIGGTGVDVSRLTAGGPIDAWKELKQTSIKKTLVSASLGSGSSVMEPHMHFGILPQHDDAFTEDYVAGTYKDVPLNLFECHLTTTSDTGKSRRSVTNFRGLVITLDVPKRFTGHTVVKRDKGAVGNWFGKQFSSALAPVKLEDPRFEHRYEVYGTDQIDARYLLNPAFMERLVELEDLFAQHQGGRCNIQCAFKDAKLQFVIPSNKQWFSTGSIFAPANFIDEINQILKEMDQLFAIIDVLKLDDRSGL